MVIGPSHCNLTLARIHRNRYGPSLAASTHALDNAARRCDLIAARSRCHWLAAHAGVVGPTVEYLPLTEPRDRLIPATWPYANPFDTPRADEPYEPHHIPYAPPTHDAPKSPRPFADVSSRFLDLYV